MVQSSDLEGTLNSQILRALTRALAHKLRSPLSVVSNDLQFLKSKLPDAEIERSQRKLKEISDILEKLESVTARPIERRAIAVRTLCQHCIPEALASLQNGSAQIDVDLEVCHLAFDQLRQLCAGLKVNPIFTAALSEHEFCVQALLTPLSGNISALSGRIFNSLALALNLELALDFLEPPLIDSLFWAQGCNMRIVCEEGLNLELKFKLKGANAKPSSSVGGR